MQLVQKPSERTITNVSRWVHFGFLPGMSLVEAVRLDTGSEPIDKQELEDKVEKVLKGKK